MGTELLGLVRRLEANLNLVVLGKSEVVRQCLVALLAGEHLLLEDVPGVGKTTLAKALAKSISADFKRVQFTPDLLPTDVLPIDLGTLGPNLRLGRTPRPEGSAGRGPYWQSAGHVLPRPLSAATVEPC